MLACYAKLIVLHTQLASATAAGFRQVGFKETIGDGSIQQLMTLDDYNRFCAGLPCTAHVVQWGGAHVWKVGGASGKVFAVAWPEANSTLHVTFKASDMSYELLKNQPGMLPAPYFASRGMKWLQHRSSETVDDAALRDYLRASHRMAAGGLPKRVQRTLGLMA